MHIAVTISLPHTFSDIFSVKPWRDHEVWVRVIQFHWKWNHLIIGVP